MQNNSINIETTINLDDFLAAVVIETIKFYNIKTNEEEVDKLNEIILNSKLVHNALKNLVSYDKK